MLEKVIVGKAQRRLGRMKIVHRYLNVLWGAPNVFMRLCMFVGKSPDDGDAVLAPA